MRYGSCEDDAKEILQEGFIRVYEKRALFDESKSLPGWIRTIIINTAINYLRKNNRLHFEDDMSKYHSETDAKEPRLAEINRVSIILKCIQSLPDGYKTVLNMYAIDNLTHQEIADFLNISINTSKSQLRKARALLAKKLADNNIIINNEKDGLLERRYR